MFQNFNAITLEYPIHPNPNPNPNPTLILILTLILTATLTLTNLNPYPNPKIGRGAWSILKLCFRILSIDYFEKVYKTCSILPWGAVPLKVSLETSEESS